ncbi:3' exoribonuclease [Ophiocordyceps sinensis CO18]|uniref:3' exoribonuclease n=1 Tax=Ophiocordyceps sinensis (strain Co18 / CGMCC 3.14243) TaxID=911162 RepID=T5A655_OPHSC|nr:3' exoribonuclease [Ophiocordyceps sinensis CO18]
MPREAEPSLSEKTFVSKALEQGLRLDNRKFDQFRPLQLSFADDEYGVADVRCGKTRVVAKVSAEVTVPFTDRPFDGVFTITSELGPMVAPSFEVNRGTEPRGPVTCHGIATASQRLDRRYLIRGRRDSLFHCTLGAHAACLAVVAALRHFRKPETSMQGGTLTVYTPAEREPVPLSWLHSPFCVTFGFFGDEGDVVLLDTTWLEEQLRRSSCTFSLNRHGEICQVSKLGGSDVDAPIFVQCAQAALDKSKEFTDLVDRKLAEDDKRRNKGGLLAELTAENER